MIEENMLRGSLVTSNEAKGGLGFKGERGYSAYEIAVQHGFEGTEEDWLATLGTSSHFSKDVAIYTTTESTTEFNTPITVATGDFVDVYVNGFKLNENEYTFDISKVTLTNAILSGNVVEVIVNRMSTNNLPISTSFSSISTNDTASGTKSVYDYVGDLGDLTTTDKTSIVDAINENQGNIDLLDEKTTSAYCKAAITTTPTVSSNYIVPLNDFILNVGGFTFQDGGVVIPAGINTIRVEAGVFLDSFPGGNSYVWGRIQRVRNGVSTYVCGCINGGIPSYISTTMSSITSVQEGDIIKLIADSGTGGTIRSGADNTYLCIEKVD